MMNRFNLYSHINIDQRTYIKHIKYGQRSSCLMHKNKPHCFLRINKAQRICLFGSTIPLIDILVSTSMSVNKSGNGSVLRPIMLFSPASQWWSALQFIYGTTQVLSVAMTSDHFLLIGSDPDKQRSSSWDGNALLSLHSPFYFFSLV